MTTLDKMTALEKGYHYWCLDLITYDEWTAIKEKYDGDDMDDILNESIISEEEMCNGTRI